MCCIITNRVSLMIQMQLQTYFKFIDCHILTNLLAYGSSFSPSAPHVYISYINPTFTMFQPAHRPLSLQATSQPTLSISCLFFLSSYLVQFYLMFS